MDSTVKRFSKEIEAGQRGVIGKKLRSRATQLTYFQEGKLKLCGVLIGAAWSATRIRFWDRNQICWRRLTDYRRRKEAHREETANMGKSQSKLAKYDTPVFCQMRKLYGQKCMQDIGKLIKYHDFPKEGTLSQD